MKGNMFLGYARGSVGDVTFARQKGQQVARARNRQPANPRTINQTMQRSLFANAVKFHSKGVQQLFKFAFEDRRPNESDYNAFMRHNISSSVHISKYASESEVYPAIGNWMMSNGSLRSANLKLQSPTSKSIWTFDAPSASSSLTTWGDFSRVLKTDFGLLEGDIVTFVHIVCVGATEFNFPAIDPPTGLQGSNWYMSQYKVAEESSTSLPDFIHMDNGKVIVQHSDQTTEFYIQALALIFSRPTSTKMYVSTSFLVGNSIFNSALEKANADVYIEQVLKSWQSADNAILQGSLIGQGVLIKSMVVSVSPTLPSNALEIDVQVKRSAFYDGVGEGSIVGFVEIGDARHDLAITSDGSTIEFAVTGTNITAVGMHSQDTNIRFENGDRQTISKIVVFDI